MIRAITFDFWRTLFRDANGEQRKECRVRAFTEATGVSVEDALKAMDTCFREFDRCHREEQRTLNPEDAVRMCVDSLGISVEPHVADGLAETFATAILQYPAEPIEGALEAVRAAAARCPVGIISDSGVSPGRSLRTLLERNGFMEYIRLAVFSDVVRVAKPQRLMFETAAQGLGVDPHELLHIGDLEYTDILGAKAVGAKAALFTGDNKRYAGNTVADYTFATWGEFVQRLPELLEER
ncbi:MAG: HAD family hydrolase [FCB group bacterium]|jgi:putative hydrolase of the HAD superfamily|nr:HAD family hydrolase [FCB group bacterium]